MKLLIITASYPPYQLGGYEMRCRDVIDGLAKRGHDVVVLTSRSRTNHPKIKKKPYKIERRLSFKSDAFSVFQQILHDLSDLRFIDKQLKAINPDIVYLWAIENLSNGILPYFSEQNKPIVYDEGGAGIIYLRKIHQRGLYFYENEADSILKKFLKKSIYSAARALSLNLIKPEWDWPENLRIYFNSESSVKNAIQNGVPLKNVSVFHSGIDLSKFHFQPRLFTGNPIQILVPSRIKPQKGVLDCLKLVDLLLRRKIDAAVTVIGEFQDLVYSRDLRNYAAENQLNDKVRFQGMVSQIELSRLYRKADVCFFPSYFKSGLSRVPLEAMACGCLVISYGNEGSTEIILDGETGILVPEGDIRAAAAVIEDMIQSPQRYREITGRARAYVEEHHSLEEYVDRVEAYLLDSLNPSGENG